MHRPESYGFPVKCNDGLRALFKHKDVLVRQDLRNH
jgi:hypothetical protein